MVMAFWALATLLLAVVMGVLVRALWSGGVRRRTLPAVVIGVGLPAAAVGLYLGYGAPELAGVGHGAQALEVVARQLQRRLERQPADAAGWLELARLQLLRGQYPQATQAARNAHALRDGHPETMATYAYALYRMHGRAHVPTGEGLLQRVLEATPDPAIALWLAGLAALERGDQEAAHTHWAGWEALRRQPRVVPETADSAADAASPPAAGASTGLTVEVSVAPELSGAVNPGDTLYVYARDPVGAPMPIAALRAQPADWPATVVLDERAVLRPGMRLDPSAEVLVGARISRSGQAVAQSGDLQAEPVRAAPGGTEPVRLSITLRVP